MRLRSSHLLIASALSLPYGTRAVRADAPLTSNTNLAVSMGGTDVSATSTTGSPYAGAPASGVRLGESSLFHASVTTEAGYDTNVFYQSSTSTVSPVSAPILRVTPAVELTNASRVGPSAPGGVYYDLRAALQFRDYLTDETKVTDRTALNPSLGGAVEFSSGQTLSFGVSDTFTRSEDPPYVPTAEPIKRDYNHASAQLRVAPGGGRIQGVLRYTNALEIFENYDLKYASNMGNEGVLDVGWRWLPKTAVFVQLSQGVITFLNEGQPGAPKRFDSYPFKALLGLRGLITPKVSLNVAAGYKAGFYASGASGPSGLSNLAGLLELNYQPTPFTGILLGFRHEFMNSPVIGTYYDLDSPYLRIQQRILERLNLSLFGRYENRRYGGTMVDRKDNFVVAGGFLDFYVTEWLYAGASYSVALNRAATTPEVVGLDYTKQLILGRVGLTY